METRLVFNFDERNSRGSVNDAWPMLGVLISVSGQDGSMGTTSRASLSIYIPYILKYK